VGVEEIRRPIRGWRVTILGCRNQHEILTRYREDPLPPGTKARIERIIEQVAERTYQCLESIRQARRINSILYSVRQA
jgi:hypothetical protein